MPLPRPATRDRPTSCVLWSHWAAARSERGGSACTRAANTRGPVLYLTEQDLRRWFGHHVELVEHRQGAPAHGVDARPVVAAQGGREGEAVGALRIGVEGEAALGIGQGLVGVAGKRASRSAAARPQ